MSSVGVRTDRVSDMARAGCPLAPIPCDRGRVKYDGSDTLVTSLLDPMEAPRMSRRIVLLWIGITLIAAACATGSKSMSTAEACVQKGGRWAAASGTREPGSGGGGY